MSTRCYLALGALLCFVAPAVWAESPRPNIVFLLADDQRYDAIGAHGNPIIETPQLDQLVRTGVSFRRAFVTTAICMTSRASIMTGQYAAAHGVNNFGLELDADQLRRTYFTQLRDAGYCVGFVGKWGVGHPPEGVLDYNRGYPGQGAYYGDGSGKHLSERLADQAVEFVESGRDERRPFCLSVSFKAPHVDEGPGLPFRSDRRFDDLYGDVEIPPPPLSGPGFFDALPEFLRSSENRLRWEKRFSTADLYQQSAKGYYRLVTGIDQAVGRVRSALEEAGIADNTVIIYTSDHGFYLGDRGFAGKWYAHEVSIRIPLIIYDPRDDASRGQTVDAFALNIDLAPTLLDYAGVAPPEVMQGASLRPLLAEHDVSEWRTDFYYEHTFDYATIPKSEGVRTDRFKYIRYYEQEPEYEELYDLQADPDEATNLAGDESMASVLADMRERLQRLRSEATSINESGASRTARNAGSTAGR